MTTKWLWKFLKNSEAISGLGHWH